jgi:hypothetical protein
MDEPENTDIKKVVIDDETAEWVKSGTMNVIRETPGMFGARLMEDMFNRPDMYFSREELPRLQDDLDEFYADVDQIVQMIMYCQRTGHWPRNTDSCVSPYVCEYFKLCSANVEITIDGEPPEDFAKLDYVHPELQGKL